MRASNAATKGFVSKQTNSFPAAVGGAEVGEASFLISMSVAAVIAIVWEC